MNIAGSGLRILKELQEPKSIHDIAASLDLSDSYVSRIVDSLEEKGLVRINRDGRKKVVSPAENMPVQIFYELVQEYGHIDWPALLSGKSLEIIYYLGEPHTVTEIAERSGNYRNTVYRELEPLLDRGIVKKEDGVYQINEDFRKVVRFSHAFVRHGHRKTVKQLTGRYRIIWTDLDSFLVETDEPIGSGDFHETGPRILQDYGIQILSTKKRYYLYDEGAGAIDLEELICHLLLIDQGPRFLTYALLLITKEGLSEEEVRSTAERYGVEDAIDQLFTYLEQEGEAGLTKFPSWQEFQDTASEYEVTV